MSRRGKLALNPFLKVVAADFLRGPSQVRAPADHLRAGLEWLLRAHDQSPDDGVSYGYSVIGGWRPSYTETTGYIAVTLFKLAERDQDPSLKERAIRMVDWLIEVQRSDGSFSNPKYGGSAGIVFDTGQDLFGLVRAYRETHAPRFLVAGERAADWLVHQAADASGRWTKHTHLGVPHVYNSRVAWALLQLHQEVPQEERERVARANLDWALSEQRGALFHQCAFEPGKAPFTHTIAYAIRGLWEAGELLDDERYRAGALKAARALVPHVGLDGFIPGQIDEQGRAAARYCCLTGNAQLAIVWAKMHRATGEESLREAALAALRYVMARQDLRTSDPDRRGAIKGSHPVWGRYSRLTYPNWPTKFFLDAMVECAPWL